MARKPRTQKMKKLAAGVAKGLSITAAGKQAGYANRKAASRAFKVIKLRFHPALEAAGYDVDKEVTEIYTKIKEKMECKETIWGQSNGFFLDHKEVVPHDIQLRAANDAARFLGAIGNGHDDGEPPAPEDRPGQISITLELPPGTDARAYLELFSPGPPDTQQPVLAVGTHTYSRRPGPKPTL